LGRHEEDWKAWEKPRASDAAKTAEFLFFHWAIQAHEALARWLACQRHRLTNAGCVRGAMDGNRPLNANNLRMFVFKVRQAVVSVNSGAAISEACCLGLDQAI
jgi:hypothetical protein